MVNPTSLAEITIYYATEERVMHSTSMATIIMIYENKCMHRTYFFNK